MKYPLFYQSEKLEQILVAAQGIVFQKILVMPQKGGGGGGGRGSSLCNFAPIKGRFQYCDISRIGLLIRMVAMEMIVRIVLVISNNVQAIGTIIWKNYPDDHQGPLTIETIAIAEIELSSIRTIGTIV